MPLQRARSADGRWKEDENKVWSSWMGGVMVMALATSSLAATPAAAPPAAGTLVILGGAVKDDNDALWQAVVDAAGGHGARIVVLPTASSLPQSVGAQAAAQLQRRGAKTEVLPIAPRWPGSSPEQAFAQAHDPRWVAAVQGASGVFMTGGEQDRLMDVLRPQGQETPLLQALRELWARGGVIAGTSAGAAVMSETAIRALDDPLDALRRPLTAEELGKGFGLLPHTVVADQHFLRLGRVARLVRVLLQSGRSLGLGVEENSGAVVRDGVAQAVGARGLLLVDARTARVENAVPLQVQGLRLTYVNRGDRFDLRQQQLLTPVSRERWQAQPATPESLQSFKGFFGDILADNILIAAMARATEVPARPALGLAWRRGQTLGFEWQLSADEDTRTWNGATRDDHTLESVRLDIRPVRMRQPLYEDWKPGP